MIGLSAAIMLARDRHQVTVLEADPDGPPATPAEAWERWQRKGVAQFRQPHNCSPVPAGLRGGAARAARAAGGGGLPWVDPLGAPARRPAAKPVRPRAAPGDDAFRFVTGRRPVVEYAVAVAAEDSRAW